MSNDRGIIPESEAEKIVSDWKQTYGSLNPDKSVQAKAKILVDNWPNVKGEYETTMQKRIRAMKDTAKELVADWGLIDIYVLAHWSNDSGVKKCHLSITIANGRGSRYSEYTVRPLSLFMALHQLDAIPQSPEEITWLSYHGKESESLQREKMFRLLSPYIGEHNLRQNISMLRTVIC